MFLLLLLLLSSGSAMAASDGCAKAYVSISDKYFPKPNDYRRIIFNSEYQGIKDEPGVAYTTEIIPGLEAQVLKLDNGQNWLIQSRYDLAKGIKPAKPGTEMPANFREPVLIPRERVHFSDAEFRSSLCAAYSKVKNRKDFPELKRLWAKGGISDDRYRNLGVQEKMAACLGFPPAAIYLAGNFLFAPISRVAGYMIGGNELASHASNFGYAVPLVAAFNVCFKSILPKYPKTAAVLAGTAYVGVNAYEEINFLGENQLGQRRSGPGQSTIDTVRTDWPDFESGVMGAATMTGIILMLHSDAYAGLKLATLCR
ncbi:MAG: hypothetical protein ACXWQO_17715 [Bdellovibrionota bacterium]